MSIGSEGDFLPEDHLIDPNFAIYSDDGNIIGEFDEEGGERFFEGKAPKKEETPAPSGAPKGDEDADKPEGKPEGAKAPEEKPEDKPAEEKQVEYVNHADYILKQGGYKGDEIEFEGGEKVKISDLTPEQQLNIITNEFARLQEEYSNEIGNAPKPQELSEEAQALVDFLNNGGTAKDLAQHIMDNDPDNAHKSLTDEELVLESVRKSMPGASEEDIQEELKMLKDAGRIEKRAQLLRSQLASGQIKLTDISQKFATQVEAQRAKEIEVEIEDAKKLSTYAQGLKEIAGVPVDSSVIKGVLSNLIPANPGEDSAFLKSLNDPAKLVRFQFLDQYGEQVMEHIAESSFQEGVKLERERLQSKIEELEEKLNINNKHLNKFRSEPIVTFSKKPSQSRTKPEPEEEEQLF